MLYYERIDVSGGFAIGIFYAKVHPSPSNACHDVLMMLINPSNIDILNIGSVDYCCIINGIIKSEDVNLLQNAHLSKKSEK